MINIKTGGLSLAANPSFTIMMHKILDEHGHLTNYHNLSLIAKNDDAGEVQAYVKIDTLVPF